MASIFLDLADLLSSSSEEESVSGGDFSSSDRPLRILVGMSTPSPLTRGTSRSTSASAEVLRKRFDGWWCIMCSLESVSPCFMLPFVVADDSDFVGGTREDDVCTNGEPRTSHRVRSGVDCSGSNTFELVFSY